MHARCRGRLYTFFFFLYTECTGTTCWEGCDNRSSDIMPPGPEDLAAVTVNCLWNQEKKTTYDYIVVPEARIGSCQHCDRHDTVSHGMHRACSEVLLRLDCPWPSARRKSAPRPKKRTICRRMTMSTPPSANCPAYDTHTLLLLLFAISIHVLIMVPVVLHHHQLFSHVPQIPQALDKALHADEAVSDMLIEEVYRSQDLDATLSSMSDDEDEDEDEEAYLPPLKAVIGELPVAGVRQKPQQAEEAEEVGCCTVNVSACAVCCK